MTSAQIVLWVYIVLVVVGGVMGFVKAGSKVSIIASAISGAILAFFAVGMLPMAYVWIPLLLLLVMFVRRYMVTKKFMPAGLMIVATAAVLVALFILR